MKKTILLVAFLWMSLAVGAQKVPAYLDESLSENERLDDLMSRLTLDDKIAIIHAQSKFSSPGIKRLGIRDFWTDDGPHGVRPDVLWDEWEQAGQTNDSCVAFPALTCLAATWNPAMARRYGTALGEEARYRSKDMILGPGVNIYRTPLNGRNFEYMGEDPYLASVMVVPYVQGLQSQGVAACVKHYALNNNEVNRHNTNVIIDDRTLHEIYLPAFKAAVQQGHAWGIMGAYNLYKNIHNCQNPYLLVDILKRDWGFDGVVVSDWGGAHDTHQAVVGGLDMEFGSWTNGLNEGYPNAYDSYYLAQPYKKLEGIVLLKNQNGVLPIDPAKAHKVLVVGENAVKMMTVGGGSSSLKVQREISPLDGLKARLAGLATLDYARGYVGDVTGEYNGVTTGQNLKDDRTPSQLIAEAVAKARQADVVIFFGGLNKSNHQDAEEYDRLDYAMPYGQDQVIEALAAANKNLVVVNISGNAVAMPWVKKVPAIVQGWFIGSEAGTALASVLVGDVNPSGKLPFTWPESLNDVGAHRLNAYPGVKRAGEEVWDLEYKEGLYVGYRGVDHFKTKPTFAFGHGLSYTTFELGKPAASAKSIAPSDSITFTVNVKNTGNRAGAEVVQLYVSDLKSSLPRPVKELKGFKKVYLQPGESRDVSITIGGDALSFYDDSKHCWVAEPGDFEALLGTSSDRIASKVRFTLR